MQDSQAKSLFDQGKWEEAAEAYGNLLAAHSQSDPMALSLAPLYFYYGVSLYHIGQAEIFSNATEASSKIVSSVHFEVGKHVELPSDESDEEEIETEAKAEGNEKAQAKSEGEDNKTQESNFNFDSESIADAESKADSESIPTAESIPDTTTPDDLTLAWEALDTARCIYEANSSSEHTQHLIEVYQALGDVSMENEAFSQAALDYSQALVLIQQSKCSDLRVIAEAHYKIALAFDYSNETAKALENLQKALELLKTFHSSLSPDAVKERAELEELFLELEGKIADFSVVPSKVAIEEKEEVKKIEVTNVNDLSALVKRKAVAKEPENLQENCKRLKEE
jgi:tetratricopeptide (TPR) repeat protein